MKQGGFIMKKNKNKNLFTLLEVLVSMGVFALLMLALMQFFSAAQGVWEKSGSKSDLFDSARIAAQLLTDDLTTAFYGDGDHSMGDAANKYIFYKNTGSRLTFATQRSGGLTEVDYNWNTTDLKLEVREINEENSSDEDAPIGSSGWVTFPSNTWISKVQAKSPAAPIVENVLYFNVTDSGRVAGDAHRPPPFVLVTLAILNSVGYEKLENFIKASNPSANINTTITNYFNDLVSSASKDKFKEGDAWDNVSTVPVPAKEFMQDNVQFFKLIIPIER